MSIAAGVLLLGTLADKPIRDDLQRHRTDGKDDLARIFRKMGEPVVYAPLPFGVMAAGVISGDHRITRSGGRMAAGLFTAGLITNVLKPMGRVRPRYADHAYQFRPLDGAESWPSGHTAMAFALATTVSDEVRFTPLTVGLFTAATASGWSRMNDNRHWFTDVAGAALIGIASAKVMNGRWRVLGISGPRFLLEPNRRAAEPPSRGIGNGRLLMTPSALGLSFDF